MCPGCATVQPPATGLCHFERLGLPRTFAQPAGAIEAAHARRLLAVHPDRFADAGPCQHALAREHAALLNAALRELQLPQDRLSYLLSLRGLELGETPSLRLRPSSADQMELYELRSALQELDGRDASVERARLGRLVQERYEALLFELGERVDRGGEAFPSGRVAHLFALRRLIEEVGAA